MIGAMFGLWSGTPEAAATKTGVFFGLLAFALVLISVAVPYLLLRRKSSRLRAVLGYIAGFVVTFGGIAGALLYLEEVERVPPLVANGVFRNVVVALIGPAAGIWIARLARGRPRQPKTIS